MAHYLWHSLASSTRKSYSTGQHSYLDFARLHPAYCNTDGGLLPATQHGVMEWTTSLGARGLQPKTIKAYLSSLHSLHVDANLPFTTCKSPLVQCLLRGIKRCHGERDCNPKLPITLPILRQICGMLEESSALYDNIIRVAVTFAYAGFLCCGEFMVPSHDSAFNPAIHLVRGVVHFWPDMEDTTHMSITLPASKTNPFQKGVTILVAAAPNHSTCAVSVMRCLFRQVPPLSDAVPLFPGISGLAGAALSCNVFIARLKTMLLGLGYDSTKYSGHSFRRGAATSAAAAGYTDLELQQLGRWRSNTFKLYIDVPRDRVLHLSSRLHWADPHTQPYEPLALPFAPHMA